MLRPVIEIRRARTRGLLLPTVLALVVAGVLLVGSWHPRPPAPASSERDAWPRDCFPEGRLNPECFTVPDPPEDDPLEALLPDRLNQPAIR